MNDYPKKKLFLRLVNTHGLLTDSLHRVILVTFSLPLKEEEFWLHSRLLKKSLKDI